MSIRELQAIDVHAHYGNMNRGAEHKLFNRCMSGDAKTVVARARASNIEWTVVSPLLAIQPRGSADAVAGNEEAARVVDATEGLLQWIVIDPQSPGSYDQARERLGHTNCMGIKIHPEEHCYPILDHGKRIFEFAAEFDAVILTHSGEANIRPADFVGFADDFPNVRIILAHIGCSDLPLTVDMQVRAVQASRHGNIYADTSSASSMYSYLIEWAIEEAGPERILFGTDTPLYFSPAQRARIDAMDVPDKVKRLILRENAEKLLDIPRKVNP
jgi:hypothetical protein